MFLVFLVILVALVFTYTNGFHDTANAIATIVGTKVLTPRQAIVLATMMNLVGAMVGAAVANTIASGLVDNKLIAPELASQMLICALLTAILWNLVTWYFGMPSSSSHALVGGLTGAAIAITGGNWHAVIWCKAPEIGKHWWAGTGVLYKVVLPMVISPLLGFFIAFVIMTALYIALQKVKPLTISRSFSRLQLFSCSYLGFSHGTNDAQKTMGIIALALVAATKSGTFDSLPDYLGFLRIAEPGPGQQQFIPVWVKTVCALTMAAGTALGGLRIIRTLGKKLVKLQPINGFAAEASSATVLLGTAMLGMPVSTTHAITTSIMGVGCAKGLNHVKLHVFEQILWAWVLTLPASGAVAYGLVRTARLLGWF
jgi:inorganic phosphate transporter, PiT family